MKNSASVRGIKTLAACALLLPTAASAETPFTATGWDTAVPVPGILCTNGSGQVNLKGNVHVQRMQADDARVTGRWQFEMDVAYQADGTALLSGTACAEVGTWDAAGTDFTRTGGVWNLNWRGVAQADNSGQVHMVGYGLGGTIDGLRMEATATRAAGSSFDPTIPLLSSGTIRPAPVETTVVVDDFTNKTAARWNWGGTGTHYPLIETNRQFTVRGNWPGVVTHALEDTAVWPYSSMNWNVANNGSLECRVDLVSMSQNATNAAALMLWSDAALGGYGIFKGPDFVEVGKLLVRDLAYFSHEHAAIKNTNVVLCLALTRVDPNVVVTARVLDKDNQEAVLYQRSIVDTPKADPTLTSAELRALSGMNLTAFTDSAPPLTSGDKIVLWGFQYTDGHQPEVDVTYANLKLRTSEIPALGIERTVRLSWPASATINYSVEGAPTLLGPWLAVQEPAILGMQQMTVPLSGPAQFFRLREAP